MPRVWDEAVFAKDAEVEESLDKRDQALDDERDSRYAGRRCRGPVPRSWPYNELESN